MARHQRDAEAEDRTLCGQIWYRMTNKHNWLGGFHIRTGVLFYSLLLFCSAMAQGAALYSNQSLLPVGLLPMTVCTVLITWIGSAAHSSHCLVTAAFFHFILLAFTICAATKLVWQYHHSQLRMVHDLGMTVTIHLFLLLMQSMVAVFNTVNCLSYRTAIMIDQEVETGRVRQKCLGSKDSTDIV